MNVDASIANVLIIAWLLLLIKVSRAAAKHVTVLFLSRND